MKKALNAWSVDSKTGFADMFTQLSAAGFDGIELNVDEAGRSEHSLTYDTTDAELAEIKGLSAEHGLPVVSISSSLYGARMGEGTDEGRAFVRRLMETQLRCAKALGASGILTVPGGITDERSSAAAYKNSFETLEACKDIIEEYKLCVGLENVWNAFFLSPYDMQTFINSLKSEYITAYYDIGNTAAFSWTEYWIEILGSRISHVHVKDFQRQNRLNSGTFVPLGKGGINWKKVMNELRKINFDGYLTAEVSKQENQTFEEFYKETAEAIAAIIAL